MRARRVVLLLALSGGCGARSGLDGRELPLGQAGSATSGGFAAQAGTSSVSGGSSVGGSGSTMGGVAGLPSAGRANGGAAGLPNGGRAGGGVGGTGVGGTGAAGEPSSGEAGEGGSGGAATPPFVTRVVAGAFHSCAVLSDGSLRCWGSGGYIGSGNKVTIGDDETPASIDAVKIGGEVQQISASWYDTCVRLDGHRLRCFGNGADGKLGYGNTQTIGDDETPASAGDVDVGTGTISVSAGPYHTCAALVLGFVRCWGKNDHYQLGYSNTQSIGDDEPPQSAAFVNVGLTKQVAAGFSHTCALLSSGGVRCWGSNVTGALGYPGVDVVGDDETPFDMPDVDIGGKVTQIVAGMLHTCALLEGGKVRCWGAGTDGRLGYGNVNAIGDDETPASAGDVDVGGPVVQLAAGDYATCALLEGGAVRCWGSGMLGELGHANVENIGDDETPASAGDIDVGGVVTNVDVGFLHVCATLESGAARCWGRGATGALGYGNLHDIGDDETPASAGDVPLFSP